MIRNNTLTGNEAKFGAGMVVDNNDSIWIVSNRFIRNYATGYFGAAQFYGGTAIVVGNLFKGNVADSNMGAISIQVGGGLIQGNIFTGNRARFWHGSLVSVQSDAAIIGNTFTAESAGAGNSGLCFWDCGKPIVSGNRVEQCSTARATAVYCYNSSPKFVSDTFAGNKATNYNGIIYCVSGSLPHFSRCLIAGNTAPIQGVITVVDSSAVTMDSCTVTNNGLAGIFVGTGAGLTIMNSNIHENSGYGVECEYYAESVYAYNNWWGDSTGPFQLDSNPAGRGDAVSDGVLFRPWRQDSVVFSGVLEFVDRTPVGPPTQATVVRSVLLMPLASGVEREASGVLLDASGRNVMGLEAGANDVRGLAPGVYFVQRKARAQAQRQPVRKVIVTR